MPKYKLTEHPAHIGLGAAISVEPAMTGSLDWYEGYTERNGKDGAEGRLVSSPHPSASRARHLYDFDTSCLGTCFTT